MNQHDVLTLAALVEPLSAEDVLTKAMEWFGTADIALASSLAAEDQVLTAMLLSRHPQAKVFTLDTGRLPQESYDVMAASMAHYNLHYDVLCPDGAKIEALTALHGPNLFYASRENRSLCCHIRKVEPLKRKLGTLKAWICGLRRSQSVTRTDIKKLEWDAANGLVKINPLADWTEAQVWDYLRRHKVPYNALHDKGYASIGCAPCTRAVTAGEDIRAGRWWWEQPQHKECGLHNRRTNPGHKDT